MTMKNRLLGIIALGIALALCAPAQSQSQSYPNKPIKMVIPFAPGGTTDVLARMIAEKLRLKFSQPVIVENRGGAAGNIGAEIVARAEPDGYTLMFTPGGPLALNKSLYDKLSYDPDTFAPVSLIARSFTVLVVNPKSQARTLAELIAFAKKNPGTLNYASQGNGSVAHLVAEAFSMLGGFKIVHIPYKGSGPALTAVVGGEVEMTFVELSSALPFIRDGKLRALGVGSDKRSEFLPNVPSVSEALPEFASYSWFGMVAPPGTPTEITNKLSAAIAEAVRQPDLAKWLLERPLEAVGGTPAEMAVFVKQDKQRYEKVIRATGIVLTN